MKIYLIAGEASGDLHASNLIKALKEQGSDIDFRGWGGHLMEEAGMTLVKHYRDTAVMGLINVLLKLRSIKRNINACKSDIRSWNPDLVIFIDYPGFNLRIAEFTKALNIPNYYYIAPKVWASRESRIEKIKAYIDRLFVILPFEKEYFSRNHPKVEYVGNPIMDALAQYNGKKGDSKSFCKELNMPDKPIVALLAGSRDHEVNQVLPFFLKVADKYTQYNYVVAGVSHLDESIYTKLIGKRPVKVIYDDTYRLLSHSYAALVASGTATLETALLKVPQVVCYRLWGKYITQIVMRLLVKVPYVSLVNLILNKRAVIELIQKDLSDKNLEEAFVKLTGDGSFRDNMLADYDELSEKVGGAGASGRAARAILKAYGESSL